MPSSLLLHLPRGKSSLLQTLSIDDLELCVKTVSTYQEELLFTLDTKILDLSNTLERLKVNQCCNNSFVLKSDNNTRHENNASGVFPNTQPDQNIEPSYDKNENDQSIVSLSSNTSSICQLDGNATVNDSQLSNHSQPQPQTAQQTEENRAYHEIVPGEKIPI